MLQDWENKLNIVLNHSRLKGMTPSYMRMKLLLYLIIFDFELF